MRLSYPLELYDGSTVKGRLRKIGTANVLFPAYVSKKHAKHYGFDHLNNRTHTISASIYRNGNVAVLGTHCKSYAYNYFLFNDWNDADIVEYLQDNQGWKADVLPKVQKSLTYDYCRSDRALRLYRWEDECMSRERMSSEKASRVIENELRKHNIPADYIVKASVKASDPKNRVGWCLIQKRSGLIGHAHTYEIGLMRSTPAYVVAHEIAHVLDYHYYRANNHGPTFMLLYNGLLQKYVGQDYLPSMRRAGLFQGNADGYQA